MRRTVLTVTLVATLISGCGGDKDAEFRKEYRPLNTQVKSLEGDVSRSISGASGKSDRQIESQFRGLSKRAAGLKKDVDALEPPDELSPDADNLVEAMGDAEVALRDIGKAAGDSDAPAARRATIQLVAASGSLRDSRRKLERATQGG